MANHDDDIEDTPGLRAKMAAMTEKDFLNQPSAPIGGILSRGMTGAGFQQPPSDPSIKERLDRIESMLKILIERIG